MTVGALALLPTLLIVLLLILLPRQLNDRI